MARPQLMHAHALLVVVLVLAALLAGRCTAQTVQYRATIRDFMPSHCMRESEYQAAWGVTGYTGLTDTAYDTLTSLAGIFGGDTGFVLNNQFYSLNISLWEYRPKLSAANYCQYWPFLRNGSISAHPDFEAASVHYNAGPSRCYLGGVPQICTNGLNLIIKPALTEASSGVPKVTFCSDGPEDRCGNTTANGLAGTSRKKYFDSWYNDDRRYNKRTGFVLNLAEDPPGSGSYVFDSADEPTGHLHPHNDFRGIVNETRYPNPFDAPVWPNNLMDWEDLPARPQFGRKFGFTTEVHIYFQYNGGEQFFFEGDDDLWVFVNGKLAIDLGGLHSPASQLLDLDAFNATLGIEQGGVYQLDLFHAERHYSASNFELTTTLSSACNVVRSGTTAYQLNAAPAAADWRLGRGVQLVLAGPPTPVLQLVSAATAPFASSFAYLRQQQNVGAGFILAFKFNVDTAGQPEGFAVVLHDRPGGLTNLPASTGANLGFRFLSRSLAIVFDMCADRLTGACAEQRVSVNYPAASADGNGPDERVVFDGVSRSLRVESETHEVRIEYLENPQWLEVYIDNSLYLRKSDFVVEDVLGGRNAFVGFTTATGAAPAVVNITDLELTTVSVDTTQTVDIGVGSANASEPTLALADGTLSGGFAVRMRDLCLNEITYGGDARLVKGLFVELLEPVPDPTEGDARRLRRALQATSYADGSMTPQRINATIVDNGDGTYSAALSSSVPGTFALYVCAGADCAVNVALDGDENSTSPRNATVTFADADFSASAARAVRVLPLTMRPTTSPTVTAPTAAADTGSAVLASSVGGGSALFVLLVVGGILFVLRRRWQRDRAFIEEGALYNMEREVTYDKNDEYSVVGRMVLNTTAAIQRERAQKAGGDGTDADTLAAENAELQEQIRINKQRQQEQQQQAAAAAIFKGGKGKGKNKKEFAVAPPHL